MIYKEKTNMKVKQRLNLKTLLMHMNDQQTKESDKKAIIYSAWVCNCS